MTAPDDLPPAGGPRPLGTRGLLMVGGVLAGLFGLLGGGMAAALAPAPAHSPFPTVSAAAGDPAGEPVVDPAVASATPLHVGTAAASAGPSASAATTSATVRPRRGTALALLATLPVKGKAPLTGYARTDDFGSAWLDVDRNGCDTRNDVLRRDLDATTGSGCRVLGGTLHDPYTGATIHFVRGQGTSTAVQIDHVVALANAWRTGAQRLSEAQRIDLANDPINLFAVDGPTNERKRDADAATWLPPVKSFRCTYIAHQVAVKAAYRLWVTPAEQAMMRRVLVRCPSMRAPASTVSHAVPPRGSGTPTATRPRVAPSHSAAPGAGAPAGATAICRDGTASFSQHRSGTCSRHGGVARWL